MKLRSVSPNNNINNTYNSYPTNNNLTSLKSPTNKNPINLNTNYNNDIQYLQVNSPVNQNIRLAPTPIPVNSPQNINNNQIYTINIRQPISQQISYPQNIYINKNNYNTYQQNLNNSSPYYIQQSTYPTLIQQLTNTQKQLQFNKQYISTLQQNNQKSQQKVNTLNSVMNSFYTKGAPLQSQLHRQIFDGSYPTLIQQADAMRKQLGITRQQLQRLKMQKGKDQYELYQIRDRVNWYFNRIMDLERKLDVAYKKIDSMEGRGIQGREGIVNGRLSQIQRQNNQLKWKIRQVQQQHMQMIEYNNKLNEMLANNRQLVNPQPQSYTQPQQYQSQQQYSNQQKQLQIQSQISPQQQPQSQQLKTQSRPTTHKNPHYQQTQVYLQNTQQLPSQTPSIHIDISKQLKSKQQIQLQQLQQKLQKLRQQNSQLQSQHSSISYRYKYNKQKNPSISVSILDDKQRDPFQLNKSITTNANTNTNTYNNNNNNNNQNIIMNSSNNNINNQSFKSYGKNEKDMSTRKQLQQNIADKVQMRVRNLKKQTEEMLAKRL